MQSQDHCRHRFPQPLHPRALLLPSMKCQIQGQEVRGRGTLGAALAERGLCLDPPCQGRDQFLAANQVNDIMGRLRRAGSSRGEAWPGWPRGTKEGGRGRGGGAGSRRFSSQPHCLAFTSTSAPAGPALPCLAPHAAGSAVSPQPEPLWQRFRTEEQPLLRLRSAAGLTWTAHGNPSQPACGQPQTARSGQAARQAPSAALLHWLHS